MCRNLLVRPPSCRQHGSRKFCGCQVIRNMVSGFRIMYFSPSIEKPAGNRYDPLKILRPARFDNRLKHSTQKPVMFSKSFKQVVRPCDFLCTSRWRCAPLSVLNSYNPSPRPDEGKSPGRDSEYTGHAGSVQQTDLHTHRSNRQKTGMPHQDR